MTSQDNILTKTFEHQQATPKQKKVVLNLLLQCYGKCQGCSLEQKVSGFSFDGLDKAFQHLLLDAGDADSLLIAFGIGDYGLLKNEELKKISKTCAEFKENFKKPVKISFSTSLLANTNRYESMLNLLLSEIVDDLHMECVVDPTLLKNEDAFNHYVKNIKAIQKSVYTDIVLNLYNGVDTDDAIHLTNLLKECDWPTVDLAYAIHDHNQSIVKIDEEALERFLNTLFLTIDPGFVVLNFPKYNGNNEDGLLQLIQQTINFSYDHAVAYNENGDNHFMAFGIGDILIYDYVDQKEFTKKWTKKLLKYSTGFECSTCEYKTKCYGSGLSFYQEYTSDKNICGNPARVLFKLNLI